MPPLPRGPHNVTKKGQVSIPKELRETVGIDLGADIYLAEDPRVPGVIVLIPAGHLPHWMAEVTEPLRSGRR